MATPHASFLPGNYLKIIVRNFFRNRNYTVLNLLGLSVGFAVFMFSMLYVYFETSFESMHRKADRIYRATYRFTPPGEDYQNHWARVPFDYINELPNDVAGVKTLVRFQNQARKYVRINEEKFKPAHAYVVDKEVFEVFDFKLLHGNPRSALASPHSVVISQSLSAKYFGDENPVGKEIYVIGDLDRTETLHHITGVMADLPANTHLPVEMLISFRDATERSGWAYTYVLLGDGVGIERINAQMSAFIRKYSSEDVAKHDEVIFQRLPEIHLESNLAREIVPGGKLFYVKIVGFAGILILMVAIINFMNLNSAMSLGRAKEIGMRKVMGASKRQLIYYLLVESVMYNLLSVFAGMIIVYAVFPYLQDFVAIDFLPSLWAFVMLMISIAVFAGLISGVYPVLLLTTVKPMDVVKTTKALSFGGREKLFSLKRVMVTLQFCISVLLLGSALIAYNQFQYINTKNLGMQREHIVAIPGVPDQVKDRYITFRDRVVSQSGIAGVSACMEVPSREIRDAGPVLVEGVNEDVSKAPMMDVQIIDHDFAPLLGLKFVAGKNIQPSTTSLPVLNETMTLQRYLLEQPREYLINETAMRQLGWQSPQEAIGQRISWSIGDMILSYGPVVGVVADFHQESLKNKVDPVVLVNEPMWLRTFLFKVEEQHVYTAVESVQTIWNDLFPFYPMEYYFLDDLYDNLYKGERIQMQMLFVFSGLAIIIAFIGLVGLIAYALKTRVKEIAVRKVLGANVRDLVALMSREYLVVFAIGSMMAIPMSIYGVKQWLAGFAYHVEISPLSYLLALGLIFMVLVFTVALQTFRASRQNPAATLRDE